MPCATPSTPGCAADNARGFRPQGNDYERIQEVLPMLLIAVLIPAAEGGYTAFNPETGTTTQGESVAEAVANLQEATELYLEEFPLSVLKQAGVRVEEFIRALR
jgi:predicted RNase H-like HicB family nuclease